jgi:hypothetical protein
MENDAEKQRLSASNRDVVAEEDLKDQLDRMEIK